MSRSSDPGWAESGDRVEAERAVRRAAWHKGACTDRTRCSSRLADVLSSAVDANEWQIAQESSTEQETSSQSEQWKRASHVVVSPTSPTLR